MVCCKPAYHNLKNEWGNQGRRWLGARYWFLHLESEPLLRIGASPFENALCSAIAPFYDGNKDETDWGEWDLYQSSSIQQHMTLYDILSWKTIALPPTNTRATNNVEIQIWNKGGTVTVDTIQCPKRRLAAVIARDRQFSEQKGVSPNLALTSPNESPYMNISLSSVIRWLHNPQCGQTLFTLPHNLQRKIQPWNTRIDNVTPRSFHTERTKRSECSREHPR